MKDQSAFPGRPPTVGNRPCDIQRLRNARRVDAAVKAALHGHDAAEDFREWVPAHDELRATQRKHCDAASEPLADKAFSGWFVRRTFAFPRCQSSLGCVDSTFQTLLPALMTILEKTVPYHLIGMEEGDVVVGFQLMAGQVVFQVASSKGESQPAAPPVSEPKKSLGDWGRKWSGSVTLAAGETVESVREAALKERFSS